jgi:hypothetical protein
MRGKIQMLQGYNTDINTQIKLLEDIVMSSEVLKTALIRAKQLNIGNYYIGAGCITQTVWNYLSNYPLEYGIKDIDFVYYDSINIDIESENNVIRQVKQLYSDIKIEIDVKNQARVHLWYEDHFGYSIEPYSSLEAAINTWPTTATAIGIRIANNNDFIVYAPFGLNDLFGMIVRANKVQITKEIYEKKLDSWLSKWPDLFVTPWN